MPYLLALDAGTTSTKVLLFDDKGQLIAQAIQEYTLLTPQEAWVELPSSTYWAACCQGMHKVMTESGAKPGDVAAISVSSQGETIIPIDGNGQPLRLAIVWLDNRAEEEARTLAGHFNLEEFYERTGLPEMIPTWPACKILWLKEHEPAAAARVYKYLLLEDYLLFRLSGEFATEGSVSTTTGYFDIVAGRWWPEMLDFLGLSESHLPELHPSGQIIGPVSSQAAAETGLRPGTLVVSGAMDQAAAAIGSGNIIPGIVTETTGTALVLAATVERPTYDPLKRLPCYYHALPERYLLLPYCQTAGMVLKWFRDHFGREELAEAESSERDAYDLLCALAESIPPASEGLILLPHLTGSTSPRFNPRARGVYFGFGLGHGKGHFVRAILEAVAFMLRENVELLRELGIAVNELRSLGGAAKSPLWLQIKADVTGLPLLTMGSEEAASLGVAILGAVACGLEGNVAEACQKMVQVTGRIRPEESRREIYDRAYGKYLALYQALEHLWRG